MAAEGNPERTVPGNEFCLGCYKSQLGLTDQREADNKITALVAGRTFRLEPGQCKKCGKTGMIMRAVAQHPDEPG